METKKEKIYKKFQAILRKNPMLVVDTGVSVAVHEKLGMNVNTSSQTLDSSQCCTVCLL